MEIDLIIFASELHDNSKIFNERGCLIDGLRSFSDVNIINSNNYTTKSDNSAITILFIATGGTEEKFLQLYPKLNTPIIILSDGYSNSLAASFEISTWLENKGVDYTFINVPVDPTETFFNGLKEQLLKNEYKNSFANKLNGKKIGLLGGESSWLIASKIDKESIVKEYGVEFVDIRIGELNELYKNYLEEKYDCVEGDELFKKFKSNLGNGREKKDLKEAIILYYALRDICKKYLLDAVTVKCFDLLESCKVTACLAMAILNDTQIVAGCEGDIPTVFSLLVAKVALGKCGFIANPSSADKENLTVDFSHCTIPLSMINTFSLPTHFESNISIGVRGDLPHGEYSIIKFGGIKLKKLFISTGELIECPYIEQRCRTQVKFKFKNIDEFNSFMDNRLGNHIVIVKGKINFNV